MSTAFDAWVEEIVGHAWASGQRSFSVEVPETAADYWRHVRKHVLSHPPPLPDSTAALTEFATFVLRAVNICGACGVALLVYTSGLHCEDCPESDADGDPWPAPDPDEIVRRWLERGEGR